MKKRSFFLFLTACVCGSGATLRAIEQVDGVYQIGTSLEMDWFAAMVNSGHADISGQLTADIDWSASSVMMATGGKVDIGFMDGKVTDNDFRGTFDGQGHRLTVNIDHQSNGTGLFAHIAESGKVCNLIIDGTICGTTGLGTFAWENWGTIENCISLVTVKTTVSGWCGMGAMTCASRGAAVYRNCLFAGKLEGAGANNTSGFNWAENNGNPTYENCVSAPAEVNVSGFYVWSQWPGSARFVNSYYVQVKEGATGNGNAQLIDPAAMASGELCFKLNGDQSAIAWTQTLGEDQMPLPFTTHSRVYSTAALNCAGQPVGNEVAYTNTENETIIPPHTFGDAPFCSVCGLVNENYGELKDGFYEIGTPLEMDWFAAMVNGGHADISGRLTADIDWSETSVVMATGGKFDIGFMDGKVTDNDFRGTFDGQGHRLTVNIDHQSNGTGLFAHIAQSGKVCNLIIDGTVCGTTGVGTFAWENWGTIENCISLVTVKTTVNGFAATGAMTCASHGAAVYRNCIFAGKLEGAGANNTSGFNWSENGGNPTYENCVSAPTEVNVSGFDVWRQWAGSASYVNSYYVQAKEGAGGNGNAQLIDQAALASGELCFKLNGDQSNIAWTQTLDEDQMPYPFTTHGQVYSTAALNCAGQPVGETTYSNTGVIPELPPHTYNGGYRCVVCGNVIEDYVTKVDGYYPLGTAQELDWFAYMVNKGHTDYNARLTADIDYTAFNAMIGTGGKDYQGTFDGQGHTVTMNIDHQADGTGFFSHIGARGVVRNLILDGTITGTTGIGSFAWESWGLVENCVSFLTLRSMTEGYMPSYTGGLVCATRDQAIFRNCIFAGSMEAAEANSFAGLFYFNNHGAPTLDRCVFAPQNVAVFDGGNYTISCESATVKNCYATHDMGAIPAGCSLVSQETLLSGAVCWGLNEGEVDNPAWTQTLLEDAIPYPSSSHAVVYMLNETQYMDVFDESSLASLQNALYNQEQERTAEIVAKADLTEAFGELLTVLAEAGNREEFNVAYRQWLADKKALDESAAAYAGYELLVNQMKEFMQGRDDTSTAAQRFVNYLTDYNEPDDDMPRGSYEYIIENRLLTIQELQTEKDFVNELYNAVLRSDYAKDTDITDLLVNADFSQRDKGWSGQSATDFDTTRPVAECSNNTFHMTQTLTGLKEGVYEVLMNGYFRPAGENESRFYTAFLSANDQQVPFMHSVVDAITVADAVDLENCYITELTGAYPYDEFYGTDYYIPGSMLGASYAFKGGRYVNRILANVTDGTLTLGIRSDGTGSERDWTVFANTRLVYRGTLDEAAEALTDVLAGQAARAKEILEAEASEIDYTFLPNISQSLRNELQAAIGQASEAETTEAKYALVEEFSRLFAEVEDCQKAYVKLMDGCYSLSDIYGELLTSGVLSEEDFNRLANELMEVYDEWLEGAYSAAEAWEKAENLLLLPKEDDYYLISDASSLLLFAALVNQGQTDINAKVTADIRDGVNVMIGTGGHDFQGIFDGQGHTITLNITHPSDGTGFFSHIGGRGVVRNLILDGTVSGTTGVGSFAWETWGTIENCVSLATIRTSASGFGACAGFTCASHDRAVYRNCVFAGRIEASEATDIAGFNWWANGGQPTYENCLNLPASVSAKGYAAWSQQPNNGIYRNNYYTDVLGTANAGGAILITDETISSGELCYKLNGDQSTILWTQTLGEDSIPYPFLTHSLVYTTATLNCGGQPIGEMGYTNTPNSSVLPPHTFPDGGFICTVCGKVNQDFCQQQDGFYLIGTPREMDWFAAMVNGGHADISARLTADIDWSASSIVMATGGKFDIGFMDGQVTDNDFRGTFDGQGHRLTVDIDHPSNGTGLFAHIAESGRVCNLIIDGTVCGTTGLGTFAWENWGTIENCVSLVTVKTTVSGWSAMGAMTCASRGAAVYRNCLFAGKLEGAGATTTSGFNWAENGGNPTYENCASAPSEVNVSGFYVWSQWPGNASFVNSYYVQAKEGAEGNGSAQLIDQAALASGELCYLLNGDQSTIVWTQNLGEDEMPYPFLTRQTVIRNDDGTYGNTTGIQSVQSSESTVHSIYDLQGRRVEKALKGIYIVNGKKKLAK